MDGNKYKITAAVDEPLVCITEYIDNRVKRYGLSIRYYWEQDEIGHKVFASGKRKDNSGAWKVMYFTEFAAVVRVRDFDFTLERNDINYYLTNYNPNNYI